MEWIFPLPIGSVFLCAGVLLALGLCVNRYSVFVNNAGVPIVFLGAVLFIAEILALLMRGGLDALLLMSSFVIWESQPWRVYGVEVWSGQVYVLATAFLTMKSLKI